MKFRILFLLTCLVNLMSCQSSNSSTGLHGLWELELLEIDGVIEEHTPYFLQVNPDGSFAVAKRSGDIRGFYDISGNQILFSSADSKWFNRQWQLERLRDKIRLTGKGDYGGKPFNKLGPVGVLNSRLTFNPVETIPDFQAFEDAMNGKWELYKIRKGGKTENLSNTKMFIANGKYAIEGPNHFESGVATINTRYRKVYFEGHDTAWDAWFFGEELRLSNKSMKLIYNLRK